MKVNGEERPDWTPEEEAILERLVKKHRDGQKLVAAYNAEAARPRSYYSVMRKRRRMGGQVRRPWPEMAYGILHAMYGAHGPKTIAATINRQVAGMKVTANAVKNMAQSEGLRADSNMGDLSFAEVDRQLGLADGTAQKIAARRGLEVYGNGKHRFISLEDFEKLQAEYAPPPWAWITAKRAATLLGLSYPAIMKRLKGGRLRGKKMGFDWAVCEAQVTLERRQKQLERLKGKPPATIPDPPPWPYMVASEAATALGVAWSTIQRRVKHGTLKGEKRGDHWAISREDVERLVALKEST